MTFKSHLQSLLFALLLFPTGLFSQQQDGLTWFKAYASDGFNSSPGFVSDTSGFLYLPVVFVDTVRFETDGSINILVSSGEGDVLLAKIEATTGNINKYCHLSSKAHLVITGISMFNNHLLLSGACRDSVFMIADTNQPQYLGGKTGPEKGFLLEMSASLGYIDLDLSADDLYSSGLNRVKTDGSSWLAYGTARPDTTAPLANLFLIQNEGQTENFILDTLTCTDIHDGLFFNGSAWLCGSFTDSLTMNDTTIYALAGKQAFIAKTDSGTYPLRDAIAWHGYQDAYAAGLEVFNHSLWVAINFSDSLLFGNQERIFSRGMADALLLQYDSLFNLKNIYQFGGSYTECIDRLFVSDNTLYVLGNTASPDTRWLFNGQEKFAVTQTENNGIQTLISIDVTGNTKLEWMANEGRLGRLTGVSKISPSETLISGVFNHVMTIDSMDFTPHGIQDVYLLRAADICLNRLKQSEMRIMFCQGDSVQILGAELAGKYEIRTDAEAGDLYIKQPGKYYIRAKNDCGCETADTLMFEIIEPRDADAKGFSSPGPVSQTFILSDKSELRMFYCGECLLREKQATFRIIPNPATAASSLDVYLPKAGTLQIKIVNADGALINCLEYQKTEGNHRINLQSETLKPGNYMVHISHGDGFTSTSSFLILIKL